MTLDHAEIARYLGMRGAQLDPETARLAETCMTELERTAAPRTVGRRLSVARFREESADLDHHLRHCREGYLYAVTLGSETDRLLRRWSARSMAQAAVGQAVCAAWLDALCADYVQELGQDLGAGESLTAPFSPGYGDWPLTAQQTALDLLDAPRRIGLTLTSAGMLVPEKSITALVGISDRPEEGCRQRCMLCQKRDCPFRAGPDHETTKKGGNAP